MIIKEERLKKLESNNKVYKTSIIISSVISLIVILISITIVNNLNEVLAQVITTIISIILFFIIFILVNIINENNKVLNFFKTKSNHLNEISLKYLKKSDYTTTLEGLEFYELTFIDNDKEVIYYLYKDSDIEFTCDNTYTLNISKHFILEVIK